MSPRVRALPFALSLTMPMVVGLGIAWGGAWVLAATGFVFVLIPVLDAVAGHDRRNPAPDAPPLSGADALLWLWLPVQLSMIGAAVWTVGHGELGVLEGVGLALSLGLVAGAGGINVAHELMHRASPWARAAAEVLMTSVSYPHFCIEHVHGHHRHVATPLDPASATLGVPIQRFWRQSLVGSLRSAWRIEAKRRRERGLSAWADRRVRMIAGVVVAHAVALAVGGLGGVLFFAGQSLVAVLLLETINYIEHYGLRRAELGDGRYERVRPEHSWNASQRLTNWFLFNLQRHSDHHYLASRPYWALRHYEDVPQLPFGYATAVLVALVPPLWRRIMDPRVAAWQARGTREGA